MQYLAKWESPSNIALVKYWGKKGIQLPANPSVSFTLNEAKTITQVHLEEKKTNNDYEVVVLYEGKEVPEFAGKIIQFLNRPQHFFTNTKEYRLVINTVNTFPPDRERDASGKSVVVCV